METARRMVWIALNVAIVLCAVVACLMFGVPSSLAGAFSHPLTLPLAAAAFAAAIAAQRIPSSLRARQRLAEAPDLRALERNPTTGAPDESRTRALAALSQHERRLLAAAQASFVPFIVQLALQESIALFGLVLSILSASAAPVIPFATGALLLNLRVSPKLDLSRSVVP